MDDFGHFPTIVRKLYSLLILDLQRDPFESMKVLALWIWLEHTCLFSDVIRKIASFTQDFINQLADEAVTCLKCIDDTEYLLSTNANDIPLTKKVTRNDLSILFFCQNRNGTTSGIRKIVIEVCLKILPDIVRESLNRSSEQTSMQSNMSMGPPLDEEYLIKRVSQLGLEGDMKGHNISDEELTMFVTFSKDYPVTELEIREFIAPVFGEYIEYILMQEVKSNEQALYAQIVFSIPGIIEFILQNESKAKFIINGKEVWMQKFVPENGNSSFP
ncbi:uncharacterized protein LOC107006278 [Solanum pennellii]|uniref:Uncharacterized protein LOC107006278 n=1 Tax=Solanum pennellii TaxID=28526 RepID=A0ABM1FQT1_SOLPN|nr:uncharacterized protein LOC107006278 [Solanum pennellii]